MSFFGKNVKKIRTIKKMSQQVFADLFSLKRATLGAYEEGRSEPKIDTIIKVANYFSISIDDMLTKEITVNQLLSFDEGITTDVNQVINHSLVAVPLVNDLNKEFFIADYFQTKDDSQLPKIKILTQQEEGVLAFVMDDLVMVSNNQEGLYPKDVVLGKRYDAEALNNGDVVIVLTEKSMFVRRFYKNETNYVLKADHVNIDPIEIDKKEKVFFWKVTEVMLKRYPKFSSGIEDKINQIMNKLSD